MHKQTSRTFHAAGTGGDITWDGTKLRVAQFGGPTDEHVEPALTNDAMFVAQAQRFLFNWSSADTAASLAAAADSLAIVDAARRSMLSRVAEPVHRVPITEE